MVTSRNAQGTIQDMYGKYSIGKETKWFIAPKNKGYRHNEFVPQIAFGHILVDDTKQSPRQQRRQSNSAILGLIEWKFRNWVRFTYEHVID
jgi:hypothetical protein